MTNKHSQNRIYTLLSLHVNMQWNDERSLPLFGAIQQRKKWKKPKRWEKEPGSEIVQFKGQY